MHSYGQDSGLFLTSTVLFPTRSTCIAELDVLKVVFFPYYWNRGELTKDEKKLSAFVDELGQLLFKGVSAFLPEDDAEHAVTEVINRLPDIRELLKMDVEAAYKGDPAARDYTEVIRTYPGFKAILMQRVAHVLYELKVPAYPRELTEGVHSLTGIDIHPGAEIGKHFFIDHGNGVVLGETAQIGDWVRLYQGVTLGVLHFEKGEEGLKKGYKRHPTLGDHVVVGAGAKILGPCVIGDFASVGANAWITEDVPERTTVYISDHPKLKKLKNGVKR